MATDMASSCHPFVSWRPPISPRFLRRKIADRDVDGRNSCPVSPALSQNKFRRFPNFLNFKRCSVISNDVGSPNRQNRLSLSFVPGRKSDIRESLTVSSGYESGGHGEAPAWDGPSPCFSDSPHYVMTSPGCGRKTPPSIRLSRRKFLGANGEDAERVSASRSAPQSPASGKKKMSSRDQFGPMIDSQPIDMRELMWRRNEERSSVRKRLREVTALRQRQLDLKQELKNTKLLLGINDDKWSCDSVQTENWMETSASDHRLVEAALVQETKLLEKRIQATKSHLMMVTVFDATPVLKG